MEVIHDNEGRAQVTTASGAFSSEESGEPQDRNGRSHGLEGHGSIGPAKLGKRPRLAEPLLPKEETERVSRMADAVKTLLEVAKRFEIRSRFRCFQIALCSFFSCLKSAWAKTPSVKG